MEPKLQFCEHKIDDPAEFMQLWAPYVKRRTRDLVKIAFEYKGYCAGGFGVCLAKSLLEKEDRALCYLFRRSRRPVDPSKGYAGPFEDAVVGDIDLFFPEKSYAAAFLRDERVQEMIMSPDVKVQASPTGAALEITINGEEKIQVIKKYCAPVHDQLMHFDLYNAMVAFDGEKLILPVDWESLNASKTLHVVSYKHDWLLSRVGKYRNKYNYPNMTQESSGRIFQYFVNELEAIVDDPNKASELKNRRFKAKTVQGMFEEIKVYLESLSSQDLLMLAALTPTNVYDKAFSSVHYRAMGELHKRAMIKP